MAKHLTLLESSRSPKQLDLLGDAEDFISRRFFLDFSAWLSHHPTRPEVVGLVMKQARRLGLLAVPTVALKPSHEHLEALRPALKLGDGACLHVRAAELGDDELSRCIDRVVNQLGVGPEDIDLVLNLGALDPEVWSHHARARGLIGALPNLNLYRSFTLVSGAYPEEHGGVSSGNTGNFERRDLLLWGALSAATDGLRPPAFGDFGPLYPVPFIRDEDEDGFAVAPKLRYCVNTSWFFEKAHSTNDPERGGYGQYFDLAKRLVTAPFFMGEGHCAGCHRWHAAAGHGHGTGNHQTWIEAALIHHVTVTVDQMADPVSVQSPQR